jgi:copper chaperone CopZ
MSEQRLQSSRTITVAVFGMTCGSCAGTVRAALEALDGVTAASVDLAGRTATVTVEGGVGALAVMAAVEAAGFVARPCGSNQEDDDTTTTRPKGKCSAGESCACGADCQCGESCACSGCPGKCGARGQGKCSAGGSCTCGSDCQCGESCACSACPGSSGGGGSQTVILTISFVAVAFAAGYFLGSRKK